MQLSFPGRRYGGDHSAAEDSACGKASCVEECGAGHSREEGQFVRIADGVVVV